jgi:hypothetical protein
MNFPYFARLSCATIIISPIIVSCRDDSNSPSVSESGKESIFLDTKLMVAAEAGSVADKMINHDTFTLKGTYHSCAGKVEGDVWILSKIKETSTLQIKKDDSNCKLNVTGFEFTKKDKSTEKVVYDATSSYQLTKDFSLESKKFLLKTNNVGSQAELYSNSRIDPENFSKEPTITLILSELEKFNADEIAKSIKYEKGIIYSDELISFNVSQIKSPDYEIDRTFKDGGFKVIRDSDTQSTLYEGKYKFKSSHTKATSYLITGNIDDIDYHKVDNVFKMNSSSKIVNDAQSGNTLEIEGALIAKNAGLPNKLVVGQIVKANIIFANTDSNGISSYKVATITITGE